MLCACCVGVLLCVFTNLLPSGMEVGVACSCCVRAVCVSSCVPSPTDCQADRSGGGVVLLCACCVGVLLCVFTNLLPSGPEVRVAWGCGVSAVCVLCLRPLVCPHLVTAKRT